MKLEGVESVREARQDRTGNRSRKGLVVYRQYRVDRIYRGLGIGRYIGVGVVLWLSL